MTLKYRWYCLECPEGSEGTQAEVQRAAERHTTRDPKHGTIAGLSTSGPLNSPDNGSNR